MAARSASIIPDSPPHHPGEAVCQASSCGARVPGTANSPSHRSLRWTGNADEAPHHGVAAPAVEEPDAEVPLDGADTDVQAPGTGKSLVAADLALGGIGARDGFIDPDGCTVPGGLDERHDDQPAGVVAEVDPLDRCSGLRRRQDDVH